MSRGRKTKNNGRPQTGARLLITSLLVTIATAAHSWTAEEIEAVPFDERQKLPVSVYVEAGVMSQTSVDELTRLGLYQLMYAYPSAPALTDQIKAWQADNGLPVTGALTVGQYVTLTKRTVTLPQKVYANESPDIYTGRGGFVAVSGTWRIVGDRIAAPVNVSDIRCRKSDSMCTEFTAELLLTHEGSGDERRPAEKSYLLHTDVAYWDVVSWTDTEVIAVANGDCRSTVLSLNIASNEVSQTTRNNSAEGCDGIGRLEAPRVSVLGPSWDLMHEYWSEIDTLARAQWSTAFKTRLDAMRGESLGE